ncbi:MAG: hypothetical protein RLY31_327 [Bacteroidota bacterium]|jgi:hypothetical protein
MDLKKILVLVVLSVPLAVQAQVGQAARRPDPPPSLPDGRPDHFPRPPQTDRSLFFIQRNTNRNTIVYDAKLTPRGNFEGAEPVDAYWLRYASRGHRMELTWLQRNFAYGYKARKDASGKGYWITLTAYEGRKIHLRKNGEGKPLAVMDINGRPCRLDYIWVFTEGEGSWPTILHLDLHGYRLSNGQPEVERIHNR